MQLLDDFQFLEVFRLALAQIVGLALITNRWLILIFIAKYIGSIQIILIFRGLFSIGIRFVYTLFFQINYLIIIGLIFLLLFVLFLIFLIISFLSLEFSVFVSLAFCSDTFLLFSVGFQRPPRHGFFSCPYFFFHWSTSVVGTLSVGDGCVILTIIYI